MILKEMIENLKKNDFYEYSVIEKNKNIYIYFKSFKFIKPFIWDIYENKIENEEKDRTFYLNPRNNTIELYDSRIEYTLSNNFEFFKLKKDFLCPSIKKINYFFEKILLKAPRDKSGFVFEEVI